MHSYLYWLATFSGVGSMFCLLLAWWFGPQWLPAVVVLALSGTTAAAVGRGLE